jgi:type I restriction enzyme S subunit
MDEGKRSDSDQETADSYSMSVPIYRSGWKTVKFGDVVRNANLTERDPLGAGVERIVGLDHLDPENLHIRRWNPLDDGTSFTRKFVSGQTLFGKRRAYQRKVAFAEFEGICSGDILTFEPKDPEKLLPELLPFICQTDAFFDHALGTSAGSLSPRTSWKALQDFEFPLPPIEEQKRIAEVLWAADEAVETKRRALDKAEQSLNVLAAHLLLEGMDDDRLKKTSLDGSRLPWDMVKLGDVSEVVYGMTLNAKRAGLPLDKPYLRVANVQRDLLDLDDVKNIGCTEKEVSQYALQRDDILVVEGHADVNEIGRAAMWNCEIEECLHQNHLLRVRCGERLLPTFLLAWINSPRGRSYFRRMAQSTSGLNTVNSTMLKELLVPIPDISTQQAIVDILVQHKSAISALKADIEAGQRVLKQLTAELIEASYTKVARV